jgi:hypothetical protein
MKPDHKFDGEEIQNLRSTLKAIKPALVVLSSMCRVAGLSAGERKALDAIADKVLAYRPKPKSAPAKKRKRRKAKLAKAKKS